MKPAVIYDSKCLFCINTKNYFERLDKNKRLRWVGIDTFDYKKYSLKKEDLLKEVHLIYDAEVYKGYYAFKMISKKIPLLFVFYLFSLIPGIDFIGNKAYKIIAMHRHKL